MKLHCNGKTVYLSLRDYEPGSGWGVDNARDLLDLECYDDGLGEYVLDREGVKRCVEYLLSVKYDSDDPDNVGVLFTSAEGGNGFALQSVKEGDDLDALIDEWSFDD